MMAVDQAPALPEYRDFISAGTYLLGVLIVAATPIIVTLINRRTKQAEERTKQRAAAAAKEVEEHALAAAALVKKALDEHPMSNGFTDHVLEDMAELRKSLGGVHGRLDAIQADQTLTDTWMIGIDDRLTHLENGDPDDEHTHEDAQGS